MSSGDDEAVIGEMPWHMDILSSLVFENYFLELTSIIGNASRTFQFFLTFSRKGGEYQGSIVKFSF